MRVLLSSCALALVSSISGMAIANMSAVKVECWGDCSQTSLLEACHTYSADSGHFDISCDNTAGPANPAFAVPCGSNGATCFGNTILGASGVGEYCEDGGGNDAIVDCKTLNDRPFATVPVSVECMGDCNNVKISDACGSLGSPDWRAMGVACDDTATPGNGTEQTCGDGLRCTSWGNLYPSDSLGGYCADGAGYDAIVLCTLDPYPNPVGAVKVETWGYPDSVNLGQICDSYSVNSRPIGVRCDDTADPGSGTQATCGGVTCTPWSMTRDDLLGAHCADGDGNDAIVMCTTDTYPQ